MDLNEASVWIRTYKILSKIEKRVHHLDVQYCNAELTKNQETRLKNLIIRAQIIAKYVDMEIYHQSDPRGCGLYLVPKGFNCETEGFREGFRGDSYNKIWNVNGLALCDRGKSL